MGWVEFALKLKKVTSRRRKAGQKGLQRAFGMKLADLSGGAARGRGGNSTRASQMCGSPNVVFWHIREAATLTGARVLLRL